MTAVPTTLTSAALRTVVMALMAGIVLFTGVAVYVRTQALVAPVDVASSLLPIVLLLVFLGCVSAAVFLRARMVEMARRSKHEMLATLRDDRVPPVLGQMTLVSAGLVEGPALLGSVTVLLGGPWYCLAVPLLALGVMAWTLPSRQRFEELVQGL